MDPFYLGVLGSLILVFGAGWPDKKVASHKSVKNWLFFVGGLLMLVFAILNYLGGGSFFFVILSGLVFVANIMMMLDLDDKIDIAVISVAGLGLVVWSLYLFEGYLTLVFIFGLIILALGYALEMGTFKRNFALMTGSILIAIFSYFEPNWIFFWLNAFFAIFSGYYAFKSMNVSKRLYK